MSTDYEIYVVYSDGERRKINLENINNLVNYKCISCKNREDEIKKVRAETREFMNYQRDYRIRY